MVALPVRWMCGQKGEKMATLLFETANIEVYPVEKLEHLTLGTVVPSKERAFLFVNTHSNNRLFAYSTQLKVYIKKPYIYYGQTDGTWGIEYDSSMSPNEAVRQFLAFCIQYWLR